MARALSLPGRGIPDEAGHRVGSGLQSASFFLYPPVSADERGRAAGSRAAPQADGCRSVPRRMGTEPLSLARGPPGRDHGRLAAVNHTSARRVLRLVNETGYYAGPPRPEARLLALRCLGIPQVSTRVPMSRLSALRYRLAAYRARIRPGTTAELASLVLRMSDEIDTRERMLDAALRPVPDPAGLHPRTGRAGQPAGRVRAGAPAGRVRAGPPEALIAGWIGTGGPIRASSRRPRTRPPCWRRRARAARGGSGRSVPRGRGRRC